MFITHVVFRHSQQPFNGVYVHNSSYSQILALKSILPYVRMSLARGREQTKTQGICIVYVHGHQTRAALSLPLALTNIPIYLGLNTQHRLSILFGVDSILHVFLYIADLRDDSTRQLDKEVTRDN